MSNIPTGWKLQSIENLASPRGIAYGVLKPGPETESGVIMLRVKDVAGDVVNVASAYRIAPTLDEEFRRTRLAGGELLVSIQGTVGRVAIVPDHLAGSNVSRTLAVIRLREPSVGEWLRAALRSPQGQELMRRSTGGTTRDSLNLGDLRQLELPIPPLDEQRRIVAKLEALQARSRRAREALDTVPPLLEKLRQSILAAAFRGDLTKDWRAKNEDVEPATTLLERIRLERRKKWEESELAKMKAKGKLPTDDKWKAKYKEPAPIDTAALPELPEGWCWAAARDVVAPDTVITYGIVLPGPPLDEGVPYIRGQDIEDGRILVSQLWRTTPAIAAAHSRSELAAGDVLLCIIRHLKVAIVPAGLEGANVTQGTVRLRPSFAIRAAYLARFLEGPSAQGWMKARYFGNAMPRINVEDAREIPIPVAPLAEQLEISAAIQKELDAVERTVRMAATWSAQHAALERAVLAKAFRGELAPQDLNDPPVDTMPDHAPTSRPMTRSGEAAKPRGRARGKTSGARQEEA